MKKFLNFFPKSGKYNKLYFDFSNNSIDKGEISIQKINNRLISKSFTRDINSKNIGDIQKTTELFLDSEKKLYYTQRSHHNRNKNYGEKRQKFNSTKLLKLTKITKDKLVFTGYETSGNNDKYSSKMKKIYTKGNDKDILYKVITISDDKILYMSITY